MSNASGTGNEIDTIIDILGGVFDGVSRSLQNASQYEGGTRIDLTDPNLTLHDALKALDYSDFGLGDLGSIFIFDLVLGHDLEPIQLDARAMTIEIMGHNGVDDASSAFRHAYVSFRLSQEIGPNAAKIIGDGHERRPWSMYKNFTLNNPNNPGSMVMDLFNNHMGRQLFLRHDNGIGISRKEVAQIVKSAISSGQLRTSPFKSKHR